MLWISTFFVWLSSFSIDSPTPQYEVYIFLHDECIISRYYTIPLNELYDQFQETADFIGVFPNPQVDRNRLLQFKEKYDINFELTNDPDFELVDRYGATVTPEAVVVNNKTGKVVYQGRVDNAYARVGKKRSIVTSHELKDVLTALQANESPTTTNEPAIGCIITKVNE